MNADNEHKAFSSPRFRGAIYLLFSIAFFIFMQRQDSAVLFFCGVVFGGIGLPFLVFGESAVRLYKRTLFRLAYIFALLLIAAAAYYKLGQ